LLLLLLALIAQPAEAATDGCTSKSFSFTDPTTGQSVDMSHTPDGDTLTFTTRDGRVLGGQGARVRLEGGRIMAARKTREVTILVRGQAAHGQVIAAAVTRTRVAPRPTDDEGRPIKRPRETTRRTSYTFTVGSGIKLEIRCDG